MDLQKITLAGGCFGELEEVIFKLDGVVSTEVGYSGGELLNPKYEQVKLGMTGHAEAVQIQFNRIKFLLEKILEYFLDYMILLLLIGRK